MARHVKIRQADGWLAEVARFKRVSTAAAMDPIHSERWKRKLRALVEASAIMMDPENQDEERAIARAEAHVLESILLDDAGAVVVTVRRRSNRRILAATGA